MFVWNAPAGLRRPSVGELAFEVGFFPGGEQSTEKSIGDFALACKIFKELFFI